jgi:TP901 family phage tail tape measure protein
MAEQGTEQLVIEAVLKDMVTAQAGKIVTALKQSNKELENAANAGNAAGKGPEAISKSLTKLVPVARRAGGELLSMAGNMGKFGGVAVGALRDATAALTEMEVAAGAAGGTLAVIGVAAGVVAIAGTAMAVSVKESLDFSKAMTTVHVAANLTKEEMDAVAAAARRFQLEGAESVEVANAMAAAFRFLTQNEQQAVAVAGKVLAASRVDVGGGNAADLTKGLSDAAKAFGLTAADTDRVLGILYATSRKTGSGMTEVASVLAQVAPSATVAKVSLEDVAATLAASSDKAGGLAEAAGALSQFMSQLSKPTSDLSAKLRAFGVDTSAGADGVRDLHSILAQIGELAKQDGGIVDVLAGTSRQGNKVFASAKDDASAYFDALNAMRTGAIDLAKKEVAISKEESAQLARLGGAYSVAKEMIGDHFLQGPRLLLGLFTGSSDAIEQAAKKTEVLDARLSAVVKTVKALDLDSPLKRQIEDLATRLGPLMLSVEVDPATKKTVEQDLVTLQAALANKASLKAGQLDSGSSAALQRIAQLSGAIEQAQAFSADLSAKAGAGYAKQRLEIEGAEQSLTRSIAKLQLFGISGTGFLSQARAVIAEMTRAAAARNTIERMTLQGQALQAGRQALTSEIELARLRGDTNRVAELTLRIDQLDGKAIELNAARARAANVEQYRGRADLLEISQRLVEAARADAEAQREITRMQAPRLAVEAELARSRRSGSERLDEILNQRALDAANGDMTKIHDLILEVRRDAIGIGEGFKQGMDEALRVYSDSANRMMEASRALFESIHDEGSRSLSGLFKGELSGKDALKQFGKGVLGNVIDSGSSLIMDNLMGGLFGTGHGKDKDNVSIKARSVTIQTGAITGVDDILGGGAGPLGGLGGLFGFARGGVIPGGLTSFAGGGGVTNGPRMAMIGDNASRAEAVVPLPGAGRGIPVEFRGRRQGGGTVININPMIQLSAHSLDPRGAAEVVMSQMPNIERAITSALVRGSNRALRDAVQGVGR